MNLHTEVGTVNNKITITKEQHHADAKNGIRHEIDAVSDFFDLVMANTVVLDRLECTETETELGGKRRPKGHLKGYSLCTYKADHRSSKNIEHIFGFGIDLDKKIIPPSKLKEILGSLETECYWHTTLSHGYVGTASYRVIFFFDKPCPASRVKDFLYSRGLILAKLGAYGASTDERALDPSRFWYWPACIDIDDYRCGKIAGEPVQLFHAPRGYQEEDASIPPTDPHPGPMWPLMVHDPSSSTYDLGWIERQCQDYLMLKAGGGLRCGWIGSKGKTWGGLYATGAFSPELSEQTILTTIHGYIMQNSGSTAQSEMNFLKGAWEEGKNKPILSKKKKPMGRRVSPPHTTTPEHDGSNKPVALMTSRDNKIRRTIHNYNALLRSSPLGKNIFWDEFGSQILVGKEDGSWRHYDESCDYIDTNLWISQHCAGEDWPDIPQMPFLGLVEQMAKQRRRNLERERIEAIKWDGVSRLDTMLTRYLGAVNTEINRTLGAKTIIGMIARMCSPVPVEMHTMLVLEGAQGIGKSQFLKILGGERYVAYTGKYVSDKSTYITLRGASVVEASELSGFRKSDQEDFKAFLTMSENVYEPKYKSLPVRETRRFVIIATTNDYEYLTEMENRRIWPVHCNTCDLVSFAQDRDQLLAEAFSRWQAKETWWLDNDEHKQQLKSSHEDRMVELPYVDMISSKLIQKTEWSTDHILEHILHVDHIHWPKARRDVGKVMKSLGWSSVRKWEGLARVRVWVKHVDHYDHV